MSNKYLEKIALNKIETYLASQPKGRDFSRKSIQKAYTNIQFAQANRRIAEKMADIGAKDSGVAEHISNYVEGIRRNRSRKYNGALANNGKKFDELSKNLDPSHRVKKLQTFKSDKANGVVRPKVKPAPLPKIRISKPTNTKQKLLTRIGRMVKKHPVATGVSLVTGATLAYGTKKNNEF